MGKEAGLSVMSGLPAEVPGCAVLAAERILRAGAVSGEFLSETDARPGDVLILVDWAARRVSFAVFLGDDRIATRLEHLNGRVAMTRLSAMRIQGFEVLGGLNLG